MKQISEWPFEGRLKFLFRTGVRRVGLVGNRTRYQSGCMLVHEKVDDSSI